MSSSSRQLLCCQAVSCHQFFFSNPFINTFSFFPNHNSHASSTPLLQHFCLFYFFFLTSLLVFRVMLCWSLISRGLSVSSNTMSEAVQQETQRVELSFSYTVRLETDGCKAGLKVPCSSSYGCTELRSVSAFRLLSSPLSGSLGLNYWRTWSFHFRFLAPGRHVSI